MSETLRIGLAGLGVVGGGVLKLLEQQRDLLQSRCGKRLEVIAVSAQERSRIGGSDISAFKWYDHASGLAEDTDVDVVCELIGGSDGIALKLSQAALRNGKHLVTANKALLAHHGNELARMAEDCGVHLGYEAAVAGGIPIIKALREGLSGNNFSGVYGILNGTCNYILTEMRDGVRAGNPRNFDAVLKEAQDLGYAEADPATDVDGIDAAHKLALLTSLVFGCPVDFDAIQIEGIRHINVLDIEYAEELGYRVKAVGRRPGERGRHRTKRASLHGARARTDRPCRWRVERCCRGWRFCRHDHVRGAWCRRRADRFRRGRRSRRYLARPGAAGLRVAGVRS